MKRFVSIALIALTAAVVFSGCEKPLPDHAGAIPGLTLDNFPVMDGSTSTDPLVRTIACVLLGYDYKWERTEGAFSYGISTWLPENFVGRKIRCSQTHGAIMDLLEGQSFSTGIVGPDIVFSARRMSPDEKEAAEHYAKNGGFTVIETPIALDALVFIAHKDVSVGGLTHTQIESIYTAKTKNWSEVGGRDEKIDPFVRNKNSGSQELMESLVMSEPIPDGFYEDHYEDFEQIRGMFPMLTRVEETPGGLGYTVSYYLNRIVPESIREQLKIMAVNGVAPDKATIANRTYPFTAEVYMMIRSDLDKQSAAYKVYEYMQTAAGRDIVARSGYVPYMK